MSPRTSPASTLRSRPSTAITPPKRLARPRISRSALVLPKVGLMRAYGAGGAGMTGGKSTRLNSSNTVTAYAGVRLDNNGSGKTTTINLVSALYRPDAGQDSLDG